VESFYKIYGIYNKMLRPYINLICKYIINDLLEWELDEENLKNRGINI